MTIRFDIKGCNRAYKLGKSLKISLYQPNVSLLDKEDKSVMYHYGCCHVSWASVRYDILFAVEQLMRPLPKHFIAYMRMVRTSVTTWLGP